jgi:hypothetical protein
VFFLHVLLRFDCVNCRHENELRAKLNESGLKSTGFIMNLSAWFLNTSHHS